MKNKYQAPIQRKTFKVLHISDVHLSTKYAENTPANCLDVLCCRTGSFHNPILPYISSPKYGYWNCDTPPNLLESASQAFSQFDYSFALFTGDMVDHNPILVTRSETLEEEKLTMQAFKRYLGNTPVFPVLGNHDSFPYSQEPSPNSKFYNRTNTNIDFLANLWKDYKWIDKKGAKQLKATHEPPTTFSNSSVEEARCWYSRKSRFCALNLSSFGRTSSFNSSSVSCRGASLSLISLTALLRSFSYIPVPAASSISPKISIGFIFTTLVIWPCIIKKLGLLTFK
ncbi:hypothetical protein FF38_09482 [Lucilia cuprina]|uniref:Calcineurin-like phosphoesterase domain-containing protein n=1 Tax=Lucilia cuprina TaxID=7375 RepID=A0A0L0C9F4_LUCCU|nr:hypothetical protein FF38_09482 [Lucilia cuprina]